MTDAARDIAIAPLSAEAFAPYGDVVEQDGVTPIGINQGFAERFNLGAKIDVAQSGGVTGTAIFVAQPRPQPIAIKVMERHPLGSQMFLPLQDKPWLVLVCDDPARADTYRAFAASGRQGVNYAKNVWHHPLLVLTPNERFVVVDRAGPGDNLQEHWLSEDQWLRLLP